MSCVNEFTSNSELTEKAKSFGQFLDSRSKFDKEYLQVYDNLALNAAAGPNPGSKEHYCNNCGQPKHSKVQNLQNPYSPCINCGSIQRIQEQARPPAYLGRSQYDTVYDKKYDTLSLNAPAGPNPGQAMNNSHYGEYYKPGPSAKGPVEPSEQEDESIYDLESEREMSKEMEDAIKKELQNRIKEEMVRQLETSGLPELRDAKKEMQMMLNLVDDEISSRDKSQTNGKPGKKPGKKQKKSPGKKPLGNQYGGDLGAFDGVDEYYH